MRMEVYELNSVDEIELKFAVYLLIAYNNFP